MTTGPPAGPQGPTAVQVEAVELLRVSLPLRTPFRTAWGEIIDREVVLVRVLTADGAEGWGECAALPGSGYTAETTDSAWDDLHDRLVPHELAGASAAGEARPPAGPMAVAALEAAVLDACCRSADVSLAEDLAGVSSDTRFRPGDERATGERPGGRAGPASAAGRRQRVASGAVIAVIGDTGAAVRAAEAAVAERHHQVKLKIEPRWDAEPLRAVRRALGPEAVVGADANGSYDPTDAAARLVELDDLALVMVEQPFAPAAGFEASAALAGAIATPVCLDESVLDPGDAAAAGAARAARIVNVKPGRVGGLLRAVAVAHAAAEARLSVFVGGMLETGIGRAAALALAARPEFDLPSDLGPSARYFAEDLTEPFVLDAEGHLAVPAGPGLGVTPRPEMLRRTTLERALLRV